EVRFFDHGENDRDVRPQLSSPLQHELPGVATNSHDDPDRPVAILVAQKAPERLSIGIAFEAADVEILSVECRVLLILRRHLSAESRKDLVIERPMQIGLVEIEN